MKGFRLLRILARELNDSDNTGLVIAFIAIVIIAAVLILKNRFKK